MEGADKNYQGSDITIGVFPYLLVKEGQNSFNKVPMSIKKVEDLKYVECSMFSNYLEIIGDAELMILEKDLLKIYSDLLPLLFEAIQKEVYLIHDPKSAVYYDGINLLHTTQYPKAHIREKEVDTFFRVVLYH